jgi:hypothetical protein
LHDQRLAEKHKRGAAISYQRADRLRFASIQGEDHRRMAQKVQTLFIDDLDGGEAEGTVRFGLDGTDYEIDLSAKHAAALRKALAPYLDAARRVPGSTARRPGRNGRRTASASGADPTAVREWAKSQGIDVKDRGRVPAELVVKFGAATGQ